MSVTAAEVTALRKAAAELPEYRGEDLSALTTQAEVMAYVIALCRHQNIPEDDGVELLCRAARFTRDELRRCERVLRPLGYGIASDRLKQLTRRKAIS